MPVKHPRDSRAAQYAVSLGAAERPLAPWPRAADPTSAGRALGRLAGGLLAAPWAAGCAGRPPERLTIAPAPGARPPVRRGSRAAGPRRRARRRAVRAARRAAEPLILMLHGAAAPVGGPSGCWGRRRRSRLRRPGARLARGTWDAVTGAFGPDVRFLERALAGGVAPRGSRPRRRGRVLRRGHLRPRARAGPTASGSPTCSPSRPDS